MQYTAEELHAALKRSCPGAYEYSVLAKLNLSDIMKNVAVGLWESRANPTEDDDKIIRRAWNDLHGDGPGYFQFEER